MQFLILSMTHQNINFRRKNDNDNYIVLNNPILSASSLNWSGSFFGGLFKKLFQGIHT